MEVDSGAGVSLLPATVYASWRGAIKPELEASTVKLQTYTGELIPVVGKLTVRARKAEQPIAEGVPCSLFVVDGHGPCLLGRDLMEALGIVINQVRVESTIGAFHSWLVVTNLKDSAVCWKNTRRCLVRIWGCAKVLQSLSWWTRV